MIDGTNLEEDESESRKRYLSHFSRDVDCEIEYPEYDIVKSPKGRVYIVDGVWRNRVFVHSWKKNKTHPSSKAHWISKKLYDECQPVRKCIKDPLTLFFVGCEVEEILKKKRRKLNERRKNNIV